MLLSNLIAGYSHQISVKVLFNKKSHEPETTTQGPGRCPPPGIIVPGAFNAMSARLIADLGFEAIYVTGAGVTNMWFGMPDQGFMGLSDIADHTARIRDAVEVPLLVDADTGFGNAVNTYHAVRTLERAGADCIQARRPGQPQALRPLQWQGRDRNQRNAGQDPRRRRCAPR